MGRAGGRSGARRYVRRRLAAIRLAAALLSRPRVHRLSGAAAEGVRRARRARGDDRHRLERRGAPAPSRRCRRSSACPRLRSIPDPTRTSRSQRWRARCRRRSAAGAGGGVLGGSQHGDAVLFMLATSGSRDLSRGSARGLATPSCSPPRACRRSPAPRSAGARDDAPLSHRRDRHLLRGHGGDALSCLSSPAYARGVDLTAAGLASLAGVPVLVVVHFATGGAGYGVLTPVVAGVLASALAFTAARRS